jgi:hypothetical protein
MIENAQIRSLNDRRRLGMVRNAHERSETVRNAHERSETVRNAHERSGMVRNGQERSGTVRNGQERSYCTRSRSRYDHVLFPKTKKHCITILRFSKLNSKMENKNSSTEATIMKEKLDTTK